MDFSTSTIDASKMCVDCSSDCHCQNWDKKVKCGDGNYRCRAHAQHYERHIKETAQCSSE